MATNKRNSPSKGNSARSTSTAKSAPKAPKAAAMATKVRPVRAVPTGQIVRSKTLANGEPRPKSRRGK